MSSYILFRHTAGECFFLSYSLFVGLQSCSLHFLYWCTRYRSWTEPINWHILANNKVRSGIPTATQCGCSSNHSLFLLISTFFSPLNPVDLWNPIAALPSTNSTLIGISQLLCNTVKWYELLTSKLTIQSYSAFSLLSNTICLHLFLLPCFL